MSQSFYSLTETGARLSLRVTPNGKRSAIEGVKANADGRPHLHIRVTAQPEKGAANAAVIVLLSSTLRLPKSAFTVLSGETARTKTLAVTADPQALLPLLDALAR